ncbi:DUF4258 domain-containing protein [Candidatus Berkelbacteria bacterium]|nr:DUF4258 domain-containing protein [Candidatus Berkelbacteria bacterium]
MVKIVYTRHAKRRMKWRKISEKEVRATLLGPDRQAPYRLDSTITDAYKHIGKRYLRISYKHQYGTIQIITVVDQND